MYTYLVEHASATVEKLYATKHKTKTSKRKVAKKSSGSDSLSQGAKTVKGRPVVKAVAKPKAAVLKKAAAAKATTVKKAAKDKKKVVAETKTKKVKPSKKAVKAKATPKAKKAKEAKVTKIVAGRKTAVKPSNALSKQITPSLTLAAVAAPPPIALIRQPPPLPTPSVPTVTVQTLGGLSKVIPIEPSGTTVVGLKQKVQDVSGIPVDQQRLIGNGQVLGPDDALLRDVGIHAGAQVYLILRLRGAA